MNKFWMLWMLMCAAVVSHAQESKDKMDSSSRKTAMAICDCLEKNHVDSLKEGTTVEEVFMNCMLENAGDAFANVVGSSDVDKESEALGQKLAMDLIAVGCQSFIKVSMKIAASEKTAPAEQAKTLNGTVLSVEENEFMYLTIKNNDQRELRFIYLEYVPGSDAWIKNTTLLKGKKVNIEWTETEVYQPKLKQFIHLKRLKKLTLL